jgi:uncharacterized protein YndB with AHSA1/START domain
LVLFLTDEHIALVRVSITDVNPISASVTLSRSRDDVFNYLVDIANHAEFTDHYLTQWHLTRVDSVGQGAGARFRMNLPFNRFSWADMSFTEVQTPYKIVAIGREGKFNRIETYASWVLSPTAGGTRVDYTFETSPVLLSDKLMESLGARRRLSRDIRKSLRRLSRILEEDGARGKRTTVGGL